MRMHISHMTFQSNDLENDTLPNWHIHTSDNRTEGQKKRPTKNPQKKNPTQNQNPNKSPDYCQLLISVFVTVSESSMVF